MSGGQVAALTVAILLLLPGGCFLIMGVGMLTEAQPDRIDRDVGPMALTVALVVLALTGFLFWIAFRRRRPPAPPV